MAWNIGKTVCGMLEPHPSVGPRKAGRPYVAMPEGIA